MKKVLAVVFAVVLVTAIGASAQTPNLTVYFDKYGTVSGMPCPGATPGGEMDSVFVYVNNANSYLSGVEYAIDYPGTHMIFLASLTPVGSLHIGNSGGTGIATTWPFATPLNAYGPALVEIALVQWICDDCSVPNGEIVVVPHKDTGELRAVDWPDHNIIPLVGMTSLVCPTVPTEDTTWGKIKSLYTE